MLSQDENFNLPDRKDRQKMVGSNLNVLDLQWELLISEGGYWDANKVIEVLGVDGLEFLDDLRDRQEIIGLWWQSQYLYPVCQFVEDGKILAGLPQVLKHLNNTYSDWEKLFFLLSPNLKLKEESTPLDMLRSGDIESVIFAATA